MISVIIPTYNNPEALDLCIKSCLQNKGISGTEILVVVDGLFEINKHVLEKYKDKIRVIINKDNLGLSESLNIGVINSYFKKILIINDDNVAPKYFDSELINEYNRLKEKSVGLVLTPNQIEPRSSVFKDFIEKDLGKEPKNFDLDKFTECELSFRKPHSNFNGSTLPIFMEKIDYFKIGGWDSNYPKNGSYADWDFFLRCTLNEYFLMRTFRINFYHFVSFSNKDKNNLGKNERLGSIYSNKKWGKPIEHYFETNLKYL